MQGTTAIYTLDLAPRLTQVLVAQFYNANPIACLYGNAGRAQQPIASTDYFLTDALGSALQWVDVSSAVTLPQCYSLEASCSRSWVTTLLPEVTSAGLWAMLSTFFLPD